MIGPARTALLAGLVLLTACDWRGFEHEKKTKAARAGAIATQAAQQADAFDQLCARDASACWDKLVKASGRTVLGPAPGTTHVSQVCCEVPKTDVSTDHSIPSGFTLTTPDGSLQLFLSPQVSPFTATSTVRGLPARLVTNAVTGRETLRWAEGGTSYVATTSDLSEDQLRSQLETLTVYRP